MKFIDNAVTRSSIAVLQALRRMEKKSKIYESPAFSICQPD